MDLKKILRILVDPGTAAEEEKSGRYNWPQYVVGCFWLAIGTSKFVVVADTLLLDLLAKFSLAILLGWAVLVPLALLLHFSARLFGGYGSTRDGWKCLTLSLTPGVFLVILYLLSVVVTGKDAMQISSPSENIAGWKIVLQFVAKVSSLWSLVILVTALAKVYSLTVIEALMTVFFPVLIASIVVFSFNFF